MTSSYASAKKKRTVIQAILTIIFLVIIVSGWFYPILGYFIPVCMLCGLGVAIFRGRLWCNWMCPRGSFYDTVVAQMSNQKKIPVLLKSNWLRMFVMVILMGLMVFRLVRAWPDPIAMGGAFMLLLTVTTIIGIVLGFFLHQRTWCYLCPIGTISNWIGSNRKPIFINSKLCVECKLCGKICPMQIQPYAFKAQGIKEIANGDCIRCGLCVTVCPQNALSKKTTLWDKNC